MLLSATTAILPGLYIVSQKTSHCLLCRMLTDFLNLFTDRLTSLFPVKTSLTIAAHLSILDCAVHLLPVI